eukprot:901077-Amphidinium_carterae.1
MVAISLRARHSRKTRSQLCGDWCSSSITLSACSRQWQCIVWETLNGGLATGCGWGVVAIHPSWRRAPLTWSGAPGAKSSSGDSNASLPEGHCALQFWNVEDVGKE